MGKLETLDQDAAQLLRLLPRVDCSCSPGSPELPEQDCQQLGGKAGLPKSPWPGGSSSGYAEADFVLFGYPKPKTCSRLAAPSENHSRSPKSAAPSPRNLLRRLKAQGD